MALPMFGQGSMLKELAGDPLDDEVTLGEVEDGGVDVDGVVVGGLPDDAPATVIPRPRLSPKAPAAAPATRIGLLSFISPSLSKAHCTQSTAETRVSSGRPHRAIHDPCSRRSKTWSGVCRGDDRPGWS
jgi:hypothetical protein